MAKLQLLECHVAIGGDILNVVHRGRYNPVTFPEFLVLKYIHGENAVTEVFAVGQVDRDETEEYARLCQVYDPVVIKEKIFPGAAFRLPMGDSRYRERTQPLAHPLPAEPDLPEPVLTQPPQFAATPEATIAATEAAVAAAHVNAHPAPVPGPGPVPRGRVPRPLPLPERRPVPVAVRPAAAAAAAAADTDDGYHNADPLTP